MTRKRKGPYEVHERPNFDCKYAVIHRKFKGQWEYAFCLCRSKTSAYTIAGLLNTDSQTFCRKVRQHNLEYEESEAK